MFILQTIFISIVAVFLLHQIVNFFSKPAPKIKFTTVEKYKSLLENSVAGAIAPTPAPAAASHVAEFVDITNQFDDTESTIADDDSVYSVGFSELKKEMEKDLLQAINNAVANTTL